MGVEWHIYSPLSPHEMCELENDFSRTMEEYLEEHPDNEDGCGEIRAGGKLPVESELRDYCRDYDQLLSSDVLARLSTCRSVLTIERPDDIETSPLQVSVLRFLIERSGPSLLDLYGWPLVLSEDFVAELRTKRGVRGFGRPLAQKEARPIRRRAERPGEIRAIRIVQTLRSMEDNPDLAVDVHDAMRRVSELSRRYAVLLMEEGALDDKKAIVGLGVSAREFEEAADILDKALIELVER